MEKILKYCRDLDPDLTMPKLFSSYFHILQYAQVSNGLNHYYLYYRVHRQTDRQTHTHTHSYTDRHTDGHEYSIVAVDKPQLQLKWEHNKSI